ncbi:phage shock protein PspC (stress-responsive transcriptional regulator) [Neomicrococcus aestuarii]|uniref:Phage shock protein PspC (Stress-responsive transcriptional regulator) n=1 Tax=Neomicrococcus aestuarii TaxID=556325 RepID=A0A7W8TXX6_9MICC|nr:PspC domain-containing protein [Neomicrococcus aestuarii]MBB5513526.1 phage shock protein PspC (stress-responsive transcriptional regulator) [Neomicrococcus aestuarii]
MNPMFETLRSIPFRRGPERWLGGVCGGIAAKFGLNTLLVRALMLVAFLLPVVGWVTYLVAWLVLPWQDGSIPIERAFTSGQKR